MLKYSILLFLFSFLSARAQLIRGVKFSDQSKYTQALRTGQFTCDGKTISSNYINDDYCDCLDGSDEPGTSACSNNNNKFWCRNVGYLESSIPSGWVNDGVCDCCDGSDEYNNLISCPNTCISLGNLMVKELEEKVQKYQDGGKIRLQYAIEYKEKLEKMQSEKTELQKKIKEAEEIVETKKQLKVQAEEIENAEKNKREEKEKELRDELKAKDEQKKNETEDIDKPKKFIPPAWRPQKEENINNEDDHHDDTDEEVREVEYEEDPKVNSESIEPSLPKSNEEEEAINKANEARDAFSKAEREKTDLDKKLENIDKWLKIDFGPDGVYSSLFEQCFSIKVRKYEYEICLFNKCNQKEDKTSTNLGTFKSWVENTDYSKMKFDGGQTCWQGPARSLEVSFECDSQNRVTSINEPNKCFYSATMGTPAACTPQHLSNLQRELNIKIEEMNTKIDIKEDL